MNRPSPAAFECAACGTTHPVSAVRYDDLGYPECPACGARTGPLAVLDAEDPAGGGVAD